MLSFWGPDRTFCHKPQQRKRSRHTMHSFCNFAIHTYVFPLYVGPVQGKCGNIQSAYCRIHKNRQAMEMLLLWVVVVGKLTRQMDQPRLISLLPHELVLCLCNDLDPASAWFWIIGQGFWFPGWETLYRRLCHWGDLPTWSYRFTPLELLAPRLSRIASRSRAPPPAADGCDHLYNLQVEYIMLRKSKIWCTNLLTCREIEITWNNYHMHRVRSALLAYRL